MSCANTNSSHGWCDLLVSIVTEKLNYQQRQKHTICSNKRQAVRRWSWNDDIYCRWSLVSEMMDFDSDSPNLLLLALARRRDQSKSEALRRRCDQHGSGRHLGANTSTDATIRCLQDRLGQRLIYGEYDSAMVNPPRLNTAPTCAILLRMPTPGVAGQSSMSWTSAGSRPWPQTTRATCSRSRTTGYSHS